MRFNKATMDRIENNFDEKKKANPINKIVIGIGVRLGDGFSGATVFRDSMAVCTVEELSRMIVELTMVRDAIEEETGLLLK